MKVAKSRAFKDRLKGHKESVISLFSPYGDQGHMLYSISRDGSMRGWDLAQRSITIKLLLDKTQRTKQQKQQQQRQMDAKQDKMNPNDNPNNTNTNSTNTTNVNSKLTTREQIISAIFSQKYLFGCYQDGTINQWNFINQGQIVRSFIGHQKRISSLALIQSKKMLVSASHDSTIRTWNIQTGQPISVYKTSGPVHCLRVGSQQDKNIQAIINRNIFYQINPTTNKIIKCIKFNKHSICSFYYSSKDQLLLFGNIQNKILLYDLKQYNTQTPQKLEVKKIIQGINGWTLTIQYNNGYIYTGCDDKKIRVYKWPEMIEIQELAGHDDGIISLAFADRMLYSGSFDHSIRSWDLKEMMQRINQRECMEWEDIQSKKYQVYYGVVFKNKKKKLPAKKKK